MMHEMSFAQNQLLLQLDAPVARIILNRPEKRHAITQAMWEALPEALAAAESDAATKVIVLMSSTRDAFCAGADIEEFAAYAQDSAWRQLNQNAIASTQKMLARTVKPTIAQISGVCVGGGCGLALACDFRLADTTARLGITPAKLGLVYSLHDTKLLVDIVGPAQAKMILFTGALFPADKCLQMGLVSDVVAPDDVQAAVTALAMTLSANSQHSIRHSKKIVRQIVEGVHADTDALAKLFFDAFDGPDHQEGVAAFLAKRKPDFPVR
jgi:enoyl-CoA hydratase/carnithine racemase